MRFTLPRIAFGQSFLAQTLARRGVARLCTGGGVTANVAHPERPRIGQNLHIGKDVPRETLQAL